MKGPGPHWHLVTGDPELNQEGKERGRAREVIAQPGFFNQV